jgi:hypothetical protein
MKPVRVKNVRAAVVVEIAAVAVVDTEAVVVAAAAVVVVASGAVAINPRNRSKRGLAQIAALTAQGWKRCGLCLSLGFGHD